MHVILNFSVLLVERWYFKFPTILCHENGFAFEIAIFQSKILICMQASSGATPLQFNNHNLDRRTQYENVFLLYRGKLSMANLTVQLHARRHEVA